jgi:hypothetical protein
VAVEVEAGQEDGVAEPISRAGPLRPGCPSMLRVRCVGAHLAAQKRAPVLCSCGRPAGAKFGAPRPRCVRMSPWQAMVLCRLNGVDGVEQAPQW